MGKTKLGITRFFTGYFKNLHRIILTNIIFAVPLAGFAALFYMLNSFVKPMFDVILLLTVVFVFPFHAGVTAVTRNIAREDEGFSTISTFFSALRDNFKAFFVHGIAMYLMIVFSYASISYYWAMAQQNNVFYGALIVTTLITLLALFISYNIPVMTVTFDLSIKDVYKNSFLMSFGELKNNFFATLGLFLLALFCATIFITVPNLTVLFVVMIALGLLIVPATASYIINFYIFKDMLRMIGDISDDKPAEDKPADADVQLDFSALDLDEKKDGEEYLFFNGKMMKRKVLIKMRDEQENGNE